jgi:serine protease Do
MDEQMKSSLFLKISTAAWAGLLLASCNTTPEMEVPRAGPVTPIQVDAPTRNQASFALKKVIVDLPRGTTIAHYPSSGVKGVKGTLCNFRYGEDATFEWAKGRSSLGDWQDEVGDIFYQVLTDKGLSIKGDPKDLFGRGEAVESAEYILGARITEIKGNFCDAHHWWDGRSLKKTSGEMFMSVDWTVFSNILRREVLRTTTEGYFKQKIPVRRGSSLVFGNAFAEATENLMASQKFIDVALKKPAPETAQSSGPGEPKILIRPRRLSKRPIKKILGNILPAVVTIRQGGGHGSGFAIAENGLIMTNAHVVGKSKIVNVTLSNGLELLGKVLRSNEIRDVALVKVPVRVPFALPLQTRLPGRLDKVYVIGTPFKEYLRSSVTAGVVSAIRKMGRHGLLKIQADVATSGGNSGGPLLDDKGNVIGLSVSGFVGRNVENLNLFIPIGDALEKLNIEKAPYKN